MAIEIVIVQAIADDESIGNPLDLAGHSGDAVFNLFRGEQLLHDEVPAVGLYFPYNPKEYYLKKPRGR